jgi:hypothetical protein
MKLFPGRQTRQEGDVQALFRDALVFFRHRGSRKGYSEAIVRTPGGEGDA